MSAAAQTTQTTPTYYEPDVSEAERDQHQLRVMIDEAATLRSLTIQLSLRLMSLAATSDPDQAQNLRQEFDVLRTKFSDNMELLFGSKPLDGVDPARLAWIRANVAKNPSRRVPLLAVEDEVNAQASKLDAGGTPDFEDARKFFDQSWPIVQDKMTEMLWDLWADLDSQKNMALRQNEALQSTLQGTLSDIKKFSSAIRMIAINSAVLATRPDQAGAGFQVISREVRQLSEDIEKSANRAQETFLTRS